MQNVTSLYPVSCYTLPIGAHLIELSTLLILKAYISLAKKKGQNVLTVLHLVVAGMPFILVLIAGAA